MYDHLTYNQRQFQKMRDVIDAYHQKKVSLNDVLGTLDFLLNALENISSNIKDDFLADLSVIEIYVVVDIHRIYQITDKEQMDIKNTLNNILSKIEKIYD